MKIISIVLAVILGSSASSIAASPLTESDAIQKVKSLPEFIAYAKAHKYTFDDNELITDSKRVSAPLTVPVWRIDVRTIVHDSEADHLSLWNRFMVNPSDGSIYVWDREHDLESYIPLSVWQATQKKPNKTLQLIKFLVIDLSKYPEWTKGDFVSLPLPANATFDQLTDAYLKKAKFKWGAIKDYVIEETQDCEIPPKSKQIYKIVRISSEQGGKFLIFRFDSDQWWSKNYDAKEQYLKAEGAAANPYGTTGHGSSNQINESNGNSGFLDLRGYPEGAKVKDPYTGEIVIVPRVSVSPTPAK